ncbi:uncharacterized protein [Argopecten irradians]|uniref:uncharacterized protein n=1 Tax=Argopecten irradians TaxID=31199 RepID=UPI003716B510
MEAWLLMNVFHVVFVSATLCVINISTYISWKRPCKNGTLVALILFSGTSLILYSVCVLFLKTSVATKDCIDFYPAVLITVNGALTAVLCCLLRNNLKPRPSSWIMKAVFCYAVTAVISLIYLNSDTEGIGQEIQLESVLILTSFCYYEANKILVCLLLETFSLYVPVCGVFYYIFWKQQKSDPEIKVTDVKIISSCAISHENATYCEMCAKINKEVVLMLHVYGVVFLLLRPALFLYSYGFGSRTTDGLPIILHMGGCMFLSAINLYICLKNTSVNGNNDNKGPNLYI